MKVLYIVALSLCVGTGVSAHGQRTDTTKIRIPLNRQLFHDKINDEQKRADMVDGKKDSYIRISNNEDVNIQVTDALFRKVDEIQDNIETDPRIENNNAKIKYLRYLEQTVREFTNHWKSRTFSSSLAPQLIEGYLHIVDVDIKGESMEQLVDAMPYEVGNILVNVFVDNSGYKPARKTLFLKYCSMHPDYILPNIATYADEPFADSMVAVAAVKKPLQLYTYAQATSTPTGKLIRRNDSPKVQMIVKMSASKNGMLYFPFLDDLLSGKQNMEDIGKVMDNEVLYYKLLVRTQIDYVHRIPSGDLPMGMRDLTDMLQKKAIDVFVSQINELHESPDAVRFKCLEPLNAQELYYLIVLGEEEIYTSSYVNVYKKMMDKVGGHRGDSLLVSVYFDKFKKFIKMAANYNTLSDFLKSMNDDNSKRLMAAFIRGLDKTADNSLEDAVDVADSYASINEKELRGFLLNEVQTNYESAVQGHNKRGEVIYNLLQTIFASTDTQNHVDLTQQLGIPPIYSVKYNSLTDDNGRVVQQVFFYGDKDGIESYQSFMSSFTGKADWKVTGNKEWVSITSTKGKPIWIFANKPLDNIQDLDAKAQEDLGTYLEEQNLHPSVVIHRGHSYHVKYTIQQMSPSAKIVILGSCGGYNNLSDVLRISPDAHIISSKQVGTRTVNEPIIRAINEELRGGKDIEWVHLWAGLAKVFNNDPVARDRFTDYIPPHKNLGALFIKAYKIKMGEDDL